MHKKEVSALFSRNNNPKAKKQFSLIFINNTVTMLFGAVGVKRFWRGQLVLQVLEGAVGVTGFGGGSWY